ncbi:MAG: hypothetical protein EA409_03350 [Saprospirales bacterium]|nr:MAG: hypothetical protein EA409_03350 [Saprospirales bacterium]
MEVKIRDIYLRYLDISFKILRPQAGLISEGYNCLEAFSPACFNSSMLRLVAIGLLRLVAIGLLRLFLATLR